MFAAIQRRGTLPVVFGLGETQDAAREDARQWAVDGLDGLDVVPASDALVAEVQRGGDTVCEVVDGVAEPRA